MNPRRERVEVVVVDAAHGASCEAHLAARGPAVTHLCAMDPDLAARLRAHHPECEVIDFVRSFTLTDLEGITDACMAMARGWFLDADGDVFDFRGISLGLAGQLQIYYPLYQAARHARVLRRLSTAAPRAELSLFTTDHAAIETLCAAHFPGFTVRTPTSFGPAPPLRAAVLAALKENLVDWHVKYAATLPRGLLCPAGGEAHGVETLYVYDVNNKAVTDSLAAVAAAMDGEARARAAALAFEPGLLTQGIRACPRAFLLTQFARPGDLVAAAAVHRRILRRWCAARGRIARAFAWDGFDLFPAVRTLTARYARRFVPQAVRECLALERVLGGVRRVVLGSDYHKMGRMIALMCEARGIESVVVQHGALYGKEAYVPVTAGRMAVWGDYCRDWMVARGVPPSRLAVTGQPRYDCVHDYRPAVPPAEMRRTLGLAGGEPYLVVGTTSLLREENLEFFSILAKGILKRHAGLHVVFKLKPSEPQRAFFVELVRKAGFPRHSFVEDVDLFSLLHASVGLITCASTMGLEALMLRRPLAVVMLETTFEMIPYDRYDAAFLVTDGEGLGGALDVMRGGGPALDRKMAGAAALVRDYLGELDGQAGRRVLGLIGAGGRA